MRKKQKLTKRRLDRLKADLARRLEQDRREADKLALLAGAAVPRLLAPLTDPYAIILEKTIEERKPATTADPLLKLQAVHGRAIRKPKGRHPLDAQTAIQLAGECRLPAPAWAVALLKTTCEEKIQNKNVDLNQRLGFSATGKGKTSEAERRARENIADQSRLRIWGLRLLGHTMEQACWMEAGRLQRLGQWNTTFYLLGYDFKHGEDPRRKVAEQLRQDFYAWRTDIEKDPESDFSRYFRECLNNTRSEFLAQFPTE